MAIPIYTVLLYCVMGEVDYTEIKIIPLVITVVEYFPPSIVISRSRYDSVVGHSVVLLRSSSRGYISGIAHVLSNVNRSS